MYEFDDVFCQRLHKEYGDAYPLYLDLLLLYGAGRIEQVRDTFINADDSLKLSPDARLRFRLEVENYLQNKYGSRCTAEGFFKTYEARQRQRENARQQEEQRQVEREIEAIIQEEATSLITSGISGRSKSTKKTKPSAKHPKIKKPKEKSRQKKCKLQ